MGTDVLADGAPAKLPSGVRVVEGDLAGSGLHIAVLVSRFNARITERLLEGAVSTLTASGTEAGNILVVRVPGAWELPQAAACVVAEHRPDAVVALGCLIRGGTIHFEVIANEAARGLTQVGLDSGVPVTFGVITTNDIEQALDRAGGESGNKGSEAAAAAIEQARMLAQLGATPSPSKTR